MNYIPRGFDPYLLPLADRARARDRFAMASKYAYIVGDIVRRSSRTYRSDHEPTGWVGVHFPTLEHYVGSKYAGVALRHLVGAGVLQRKYIESPKGGVYTYRDGQATQYRLTDAWQKRDLQAFELHPSYVRKIEAHADEMRAEVFSKYPHLENTFELLQGVRLAEGWAEVVPGVDDPFRRASYLLTAAEVENMERGRFIFKLGPKGGRLFHPVTWMPRALREFIQVERWEGEPLAMVDISNSQPLMMAACLACAMDAEHPLRGSDSVGWFGFRDPRELQLATLERTPDPFRDLASSFAQAAAHQNIENQLFGEIFDPLTPAKERRKEEREGRGGVGDPKCTEPAAPENTGGLANPSVLERAILASGAYLMSSTDPNTLTKLFSMDANTWFDASGLEYHGTRYETKKPTGWRMSPFELAKKFVRPDLLVELLESQGVELTPTDEWHFIEDAVNGTVYECLQNAMCARTGEDVTRDETKLAFMDSMAFHNPKKWVDGVSVKFDGLVYRGMWERVYHETYPEAFALGRWVRARVGKEGQIRLLQQLEAELVLGRVLARLDGWAIPIHDALIVRARDAQRVVEIFKEEAGALLKLGLPLKVSEMGNLWTAK